MIIWEFVANNGQQVMESDKPEVKTPILNQDKIIDKVALFRSEAFSPNVKQLTAARWLNKQTILVSFNDGSIYLKSVDQTYQNPLQLFREKFNPVRDMVYLASR